MKKTIIFAIAAGALVAPFALAAEFLQNPVPGQPAGLPSSLTYSPGEHSWLAERFRSLAEGAAYGAADNQPPYVMLAGYYDTDVTYESGGTLKLIAYVMDPDGYSDLARVELFYAGLPTSVLLYDDGAHGDFASGDEVFGLSFTLAPGDLPPGSYTLEIMAVDQSGNQSDLWPYLTVHP